MIVVDPNSHGCRWEQDKDGIWHTSCDQEFVTIDGLPSENRMRFCCYCGGHLVEEVFALDEADGDDYAREAAREMENDDGTTGESDDSGGESERGRV